MTPVLKRLYPLLTGTLVGFILGGVIPAIVGFVYIEWTRPNDPEIPDVNGLAVVVAIYGLMLGASYGAPLGLLLNVVWDYFSRRCKAKGTPTTEGKRTDESPRLPPGWRDNAPRMPPDPSGIEEAPP